MVKETNDGVQTHRKFEDDYEALRKIEDVLSDPEARWCYASGAKCFWAKESGEAIKWLDTHEEAYQWMIHNLAVTKLGVGNDNNQG